MALRNVCYLRNFRCYRCPTPGLNDKHSDGIIRKTVVDRQCFGL